MTSTLLPHRFSSETLHRIAEYLNDSHDVYNMLFVCRHWYSEFTTTKDSAEERIIDRIWLQRKYPFLDVLPRLDDEGFPWLAYMTREEQWSLAFGRTSWPAYHHICHESIFDDNDETVIGMEHPRIAITSYRAAVKILKDIDSNNVIDLQENRQDDDSFELDYEDGYDPTEEELDNHYILTVSYCLNHDESELSGDPERGGWGIRGHYAALTKRERIPQHTTLYWMGKLDRRIMEFKLEKGDCLPRFTDFNEFLQFDDLCLYVTDPKTLQTFQVYESHLDETYKGDCPFVNKCFDRVQLKDDFDYTRFEECYIQVLHDGLHIRIHFDCRDGTTFLQYLGRKIPLVSHAVDDD